MYASNTYWRHSTWAIALVLQQFVWALSYNRRAHHPGVFGVGDRRASVVIFGAYAQVIKWLLENLYNLSMEQVHMVKSSLQGQQETPHDSSLFPCSLWKILAKNACVSSNTQIQIRQQKRSLKNRWCKHKPFSLFADSPPSILQCFFNGIASQRSYVLSS